MIKDLQNIVMSFLYFEKQIGYKKHRKYLHDLFGPYVCRRESEYDENTICVLRRKGSLKIKAAFRMKIGFQKACKKKTYHITQLFELDKPNPVNCRRWYKRGWFKVSYFITDLRGLAVFHGNHPDYTWRLFRTDYNPITHRWLKRPRFDCLFARDRSCIPYKELLYEVTHDWRDYAS